MGKPILFIFILISNISISQCVLSPVADLRFSGNANDISGNNNNGAVVGPVLVSDRYGLNNSAYNFDGNDDYIEIPGNPTLDFSNALTVSAWVKIAGTGGQDQKIIEQCDINSFWANYQFFIASTGELAVGLRSSISTTSYTVSSDQINVGQWTHVSFTWGSSVNSGLCKIFINGNEVNYTQQEQLQTNLFLDTPESTKIGADIHSPLNPFNGTMDELKIFGCALTESQLDSIFYSEAPAYFCNMNVNPNITDPTCFGFNDGGITVNASGGSGSFSYLWSNGQTTSGIAGLFAGDYFVTINDGAVCDTTIMYSVIDPMELDFSININDPSCGASDGNATATVFVGQSPFEYQWSSGDTLSSADSLSAGIYMLVVTDANGCSSSETFGVDNTIGIGISATVTDASCEGVFDGDIDLTVSGGTGPYTYSWSNAAVTEDLTNIKSGAYMVQVTDVNGCIAVYTVSVSHNEIDLSNVFITDPTCGNTNGSISVTPSGGVLPYTYLWGANAGSATTSNISGYGTGAYYLMVTDGNGCSETQSYMLSNPGGPVVELISITNSTCDGTGGNVNVAVASGMPPFSYSWSNGSTTQDLSNLTQGVYDLDVMDGNGCITMFSAEVQGTLPPPITLCMTTVDSTNGKVLCVWEKPNLDYMSHFNIYRENAIAGQYDFWFTKPWDSLSQWTDQSANPMIRGWRYKVTMVDTCGNESNFGTNHKTIHLNANLGVGGVVNLIWDDYEGFPVTTFYIDRYHPSTGWVLIDSLPSSLHSYTDPSPPGLGNLKYSIDVKPQNVCTSTRAVNHNYTRSNRGGFAEPTSISKPTETTMDVNLYPNPSTGTFTIELLNGEGSIIEITDLTGRLIFSTSQNVLRKEYDLSEISNGVYIVKLVSENRSFKTRWVKQ